MKENLQFLILANLVIFDVVRFLSVVNFHYFNELWAPFRKVLAVLVGLFVSPCQDKIVQMLNVKTDKSVGCFYLSFVPDESSTELREPAVLPAPSNA